MRRFLRFFVFVVLVLAVVRWLLGDDRRRSWRLIPGRLRGLRYRLSGEHPDPNVDDRTLADRVRSTIGPLERRLDVPHVHVMVQKRVALLHGDVSRPAEADAIEAAVRRVAGIEGIESYLHIGLLASDTRPSAGRAAVTPSPAYRSLVRAAEEAGAGPTRSRAAVRAVLAALADRIPERERSQFLGHLPRDVREMAEPPTRLGRAIAPPRTVEEVLADVIAHSDLSPGVAGRVAGAVVAELRRLVPEEVDDVAATLPADIQAWWLGAPVPGR